MRRAHSLLKAKGVQGKNLNELASCEQITPEMIERQAYRISQAEDVRNAPAVLVRALAEEVGLELASKRLRKAEMTPEKRRNHEADQGFAKKMEDLQRNRQRDAS